MCDSLCYKLSNFYNTISFLNNSPCLGEDRHAYCYSVTEHLLSNYYKGRCWEMWSVWRRTRHWLVPQSFYSIKGNRYTHIYSVIHMLIIYSFSVLLHGNTRMKEIQQRSPLWGGETEGSNMHDKGFFEKYSYCVLVTQLCPTLCDALNCSPPGSSVHGILQARILEWVAIPFSRGSSWPRDQTWVPCTAGRFFTIWATWQVLKVFLLSMKVRMSPNSTWE